jgi:hypothetical protein
MCRCTRSPVLTPPARDADEIVDRCVLRLIDGALG